MRHTLGELHAWLPVVGRYALLTAVQERDLARRARAGCDEARQALVTANLRLVIMVAGRFRGRGLELSELVAEGHVGLLRAVPKFDPDAGCRFSTYAVWWIQQSIRRALQRCRPIRLPAHMQARTATWRAAAAELTRVLGRTPLTAEVAARTHLSSGLVSGVVDAVTTAGRRHGPLEAPSEEEDGGVEVVVPDASASPWEQAHATLERERLAQLLSRLDERSRTVLELRFGLTGGPARTLVEVGELMNVTRERVRQLQARALAVLRREARLNSAPRADTIRAA